MQRAIDEGNKYVARMLTWCDASDLKQILILQREVERMAEDDAPLYRVCPTCGNFIEEELHTHFCPHCMTASEEFLVFN
jgi:rubrerythrin